MDTRNTKQKEVPKKKNANQLLQRIQDILLPLVLLGLAVIIVETLITFHMLSLSPLVGKVLILPALLIALFLHIGSMGAMSDKDWSHSNVVGCIPNLFGLFGLLGYLSYIVGISMIAMPAWNQWGLGAPLMYLSGILSAPLIVLYLQQPKKKAIGENSVQTRKS